jgi:hypothetical protein
MPPVQQSEEIGLAVGAGGDQLAIDDAGLRRQPENGAAILGNLRVRSPPFRP